MVCPLHPIYDHRIAGPGEPRPASALDFARAEEFFATRHSVLPKHLARLWSTIDGAEWDGTTVWDINQVLTTNEELRSFSAEHVLIGTSHDEYLGLHLKTGRVDFLDRIAGDPRPGFPALADLIDFLASAQD